MKFITLFLNLDNDDYNCAGNAARDSLPRFYIFRGERIKDDYIKHYKVKTWMAMQGKHGWYFFIQRICIIFQEVNLKQHHKIQSTSINFRWTWVTCYIINIEQV